MTKRWGLLTLLPIFAIIITMAIFFTLAASEFKWDPEPGAHDDHTETDMVITWVDTGDPEWYARFMKAKTGQTGDQDIVSDRTTHEEVEDIEYAVRLARLNMPWIRTIWVLTQRPQCPLFMKDPDVREKLGVRLVHHDECGLEEPTYSGMVVSTLPCKIPGLTERYIRMDDDVFITEPSPRSEYYDSEGRPILRCAWHPLPAPLFSLWPWWKDYTHVRITTHRALRKLLRKPLYRQLDTNHRPWATVKSLELRALEAAADEVGRLRPVRSADDIDFGPLFCINWLAHKARDEIVLRPSSGLRDCSPSDLPAAGTGINSINSSITDEQRDALEALVQVTKNRPPPDSSNPLHD